MSAKNESAKFISLLSAGGFTWVGLIAVLGGFSLSPLAAGSLIFGSGLLAGASALNFAVRDEIGCLKELASDLKNELEALQLKKEETEAELSQQLLEAQAERDEYCRQLDLTRKDLMAECKRLQIGLKYWEDGLDPRILELEPVKKLIDLLNSKLKDKAEQLKLAQEAIEELETANGELNDQIVELETYSEQLDSELAEKTLALDKLQTNFDLKLELAIQHQIAPRLQKAVSYGLQEKQAEINRLNEAIAILQEEISEKQAILDAIEVETLPKIETTYKHDINALDSKLMHLSGENSLLREEIERLKSPQQFPGTTYADDTGNRIIDHFFAYGVIFDAHDTDLIEGGYRLRFRVNRNDDQTKLSAEHFNKVKNERGMLGLSHRELDFKLDYRNLLVTVNIYPEAIGNFSASPGLRADSERTYDRTSEVTNLSTIGGVLTGNLSQLKTGKPKPAKGNKQAHRAKSEPDLHRQKFIDLGCYPADQFGEVVRHKFVNRVRVCAGSTGGKSPLLEVIAVWLAKLNNGVLCLVNPIPGSPKDWFRVPGVIQSKTDSGVDTEVAIIRAVEEFHGEFKERRNNLKEAQGKDYMIMALDEDNSTARDYENLGAFFKDMYQLSDHANMGFCSAGQGINVSGLSGGSRPRKTKTGEEQEKNTGNATKLMKEDFQNATLVLTSEQIKAWVTKHSQGTVNKTEMLEKHAQLQNLCDTLNELEGLVDRPKIGDDKKVSPNAYRIALVVSPGHAPFFIQQPAYSDFDLDGVRFPEGAKVTSPHWQESPDLADEAFIVCPKCDGSNVTKMEPYADGCLRFRCNKVGCRKTFRVED